MSSSENSLRLTLNLCHEVSAQLDNIGHHTPEGGMYCLALSEEENRSKRLVGREAAKLGARVFETMAGGITMFRPGNDRKLKTFMIGSHLDAVPAGGQYDGRAGVLAGLAVLKMLHETNTQLDHGYAVHVFPAEESPRFGKALLVSGMETGRGLKSDFDLVSRLEADNGLTVAQALAGQGHDVRALKEKVAGGKPLLPLSHIGGFAELHIEQAKRLRNAGMDIGVVNASRGNVRADIRFLGETGHSGAEAQFELAADATVTDVRKDASIGMSLLSAACYTKAKEIAVQGRDITYTLPEVVTPGASLTNICADCRARIEVRSIDQGVLEEMAAFIEQQTADIAQEHGLKVHTDTQSRVSQATPAMSKKMIDHLTRSAGQIGLNAMTLASGAGHDAMNMYLAGVLTSMYFMPHDGKSHRPDEQMVLNDGDDPYGLGNPFSNAASALFEVTCTYNMAKIQMQHRPVSFAQAMVNHGAREITQEL